MKVTASVSTGGSEFTLLADRILRRRFGVKREEETGENCIMIRFIFGLFTAY
jgi:hypothetical protein